jgi:peroxiredoxin
MSDALAVDHPFPDIDVVDPHGSPRRLRDEIGGRVAVVHFMRSSSCPVCLAHAAAMQRMKDAGEVGDAVLILVAPGAAAEAADAARRAAGRAPSIRVRASVDGHERSGLTTTAFLQRSATVVVDPAGDIRDARIAALPTASFDADAVRAALAGIAAQAWERSLEDGS